MLPEPIGDEVVAVIDAVLQVNLETLTAFKKQVDDALKALDTSPASNTRLSEQTLSRSSYGQGFAEAEELATAYEQAHDNLRNLSKSLGDQLEALSLAVECAHKGVNASDEQQAERLRQLQAQTQKTYDRSQQQHGHHDQPQGSRGGKQLSGGDGL